MKQLVILSGKGGSGKTSLTACFAQLASLEERSLDMVLVDADVDAANLELIVQPHLVNREKFYGGQVAQIDPNLCSNCGICAEVCRFDAVHQKEEFQGSYTIDPIACDGCASCYYQCPSDAITMNLSLAGEWFYSTCQFGPLFHAALKPAQDNSGKLVTLIREKARLHALDNHCNLVIIDGPPGIGCPVIAAASGTDLALIVTEPTISGISDMKRALHTTKHFELQSVVCINQADINPQGTEEIQAYCEKNGIDTIGQVPFDTNVSQAMSQGQAVTAYNPDTPASQSVRSIWGKLRELVRNQD